MSKKSKSQTTTQADPNDATDLPAEPIASASSEDAPSDSERTAGTAETQAPPPAEPPVDLLATTAEDASVELEGAELAEAEPPPWSPARPVARRIEPANPPVRPGTVGAKRHLPGGVLFAPAALDVQTATHDELLRWFESVILSGADACGMRRELEDAAAQADHDREVLIYVRRLLDDRAPSSSEAGA